MTEFRDYAAILLCDLDGTLVEAPSALHSLAMLRALERVLGGHEGIYLDGHQLCVGGDVYDGLIDSQLFRMAMRTMGLDDAGVARHLPAVCRAMGAVYIALAIEVGLATSALSSARDTLRRLAACGVALGLVTGNVAEVAEHKLLESDLIGLFPIRACGDTARDRVELIKAARGLAADYYGACSNTPVLYVGDTPNDVRAARLAAVPSIAVASGRWSCSHLALQRPALLLESLCRQSSVHAIMRLAGVG